MFLNKEGIIINYFSAEGIDSFSTKYISVCKCFLIQDIDNFFLNSLAMPFLVLLCIVCLVTWFLFYTSERITVIWEELWEAGM